VITTSTTTSKGRDFQLRFWRKRLTHQIEKESNQVSHKSWCWLSFSLTWDTVTSLCSSFLCQNRGLVATDLHMREWHALCQNRSRIFSCWIIKEWLWLSQNLVARVVYLALPCHLLSQFPSQRVFCCPVDYSNSRIMVRCHENINLIPRLAWKEEVTHSADGRSNVQKRSH